MVWSVLYTRGSIHPSLYTARRGWRIAALGLLQLHDMAGPMTMSLRGNIMVLAHKLGLDGIQTRWSLGQNGFGAEQGIVCVYCTRQDGALSLYVFRDFG